MDIIKFNNPIEPTLMQQAEIINGIKSKMWIERYRDAGEFTLVVDVDKGLTEKLPIGSFISHIDSDEIMVVEDHEIKENQNSPSELIITGRSLETILENRIVGSNPTGGFPDTINQNWDPNYFAVSGYTWIQAKNLIDNHTKMNNVSGNEEYELLYLQANYNLQSPVVLEMQNWRVLPVDTVHKALLEILKIDDLGVKIFRRNSAFWGGVTHFLIHNGVDKTQTVTFSYDGGEIVSASYLWSSRNYKNSAFVTSKWFRIFVNPLNAESLDLRTIHVDGSDLDGDYATVPTGTDLTNVLNALEIRALEALAAYNNVEIMNPEVSKENLGPQYRQDYDVGDIVTVLGNYNQSITKRVTEFVEIEDENGVSGYPTFARIGE